MVSHVRRLDLFFSAYYTENPSVSADHTLRRSCGRTRRSIRRVVHLKGEGERGELAYDQLVLALGGMTNRTTIPDSEHAFTFKTLADAFLRRNHFIERLERAAVEPDPRASAGFSPLL